MNSLLYAKLAKTNLSKNRQNILPYWLSCIGTVIMFYIMSTLSLSEGLKKMMGEATIQIVMQFGVYIIGLFAVIFLIYSNSFLAIGSAFCFISRYRLPSSTSGRKILSFSEKVSSRLKS